MESSKKTAPEQDKTIADPIKPSLKEPHTPSAQQASPQPYPSTAPPGEPKSTIEDAAGAVADRAAKAYDQTKQVVSQAYEKTSQVATETYDRAITYGKQNPGTLTLIAFGAGIGIGLLLAGGFSSRSRTSNFIEPIGNALTQIGLKIFR